MAKRIPDLVKVWKVKQDAENGVIEPSDVLEVTEMFLRLVGAKDLSAQYLDPPVVYADGKVIRDINADVVATFESLVGDIEGLKTRLAKGDQESIRAIESAQDEIAKLTFAYETVFKYAGETKEKLERATNETDRDRKTQFTRELVAHIRGFPLPTPDFGESMLERLRTAESQAEKLEESERKLRRLREIVNDR